jgi:glycine hydroxymethyltransferase
MSISRATLKEFDPAIYNLIQEETARQEYGLEMIPSENFVSEAVLEAAGSILTNKYAEGLPQKRYYGGCEFVDQVEQIAIDRAKQLFGVDFANVQPHSGSQANQAVFDAVMRPGDTFLGMRLDHGGHLTHGSPVNVSGKNYKVVAYGVRESDELIDPDQVRSLALEHRPKLIIAGASAYSRVIDFKMFRDVADEIGAVFMADIAHYAGLIAAGVYPSPYPHAHIVTTTTHKTLRGPRAGLILGNKDWEKACNKSIFPGMQGGPLVHIIAAKAVAFKEAMQPSFKDYSVKVIENARALSAELISKGLRIVSGGTDSHVLMIDLRPIGLTGKEAQEALDKVHITANKNTIPFDPQPPSICSGVRIGTPAITTRGLGVSDMKLIAGLISRTFECKGDAVKLASIRDEVRDISNRYPLYKHRLV